MIRVFPTEREAKRQVLLDAVDKVHDVLAAGADEAEDIATLPKTTVEALYESGLLSLKLPAELGGAEADLLTQLDVFEAVTRIDTSAGWCLLIGSASLGRLGAFLPDDALERLFIDGRPPKTSGVAMRSGEAHPVEGGLPRQWPVVLCQWHSALRVGDGRGSRRARWRHHIRVSRGGVSHLRSDHPRQLAGRRVARDRQQRFFRGRSLRAHCLHPGPA